jgi:hypothetical protein
METTGGAGAHQAAPSEAAEGGKVTGAGGRYSFGVRPRCVPQTESTKTICLSSSTLK